jgi:hypothetical protein
VTGTALVLDGDAFGVHPPSPQVRAPSAGAGRSVGAAYVVT